MLDKFKIKFESNENIVQQTCVEIIWLQTVTINMSTDMRFPKMRYVKPAKPQISLCICAV